MLNDILSVIKPDLILMDGIVGMEGDGPAGGNPVEIGITLASDNPYAIDLSVCKILNIEPIGIPTLKDAKIRNLWPKEIKYPILNPDDVKYDNFILPSTAGYILTGKKIPNKYPVINKNCIKCGECVKICPKKIIKINENKIKIDYSGCIKCYCCHEICQYNAINLETIN
jgi:ferredoxin